MASLRAQVAEFEEADKKRRGKELIEKVIKTPPKPPLPRPRWQAGPDNTQGPDHYVIQNTVPRSVAKEVRVEADSDMNIIDAGHWQDLSTEGPTKGVGTFIAVAMERGIDQGVQLTVSWYDENGRFDQVNKLIWPPKPEGFAVSQSQYPDETPF